MPLGINAEITVSNNSSVFHSPCTTDADADDGVFVDVAVAVVAIV